LKLRCSEKTAFPGRFVWALVEDGCDQENELEVGDVLMSYEAGSGNESVSCETQSERGCAGMGSPVLGGAMTKRAETRVGKHWGEGKKLAR
jgi:hypothetical protein